MGQMMGERGIGRESHHWNSARAATVFFCAPAGGGAPMSQVSPGECLSRSNVTMTFSDESKTQFPLRMLPAFEHNLN
jgi:hypothetical protein